MSKNLSFEVDKIIKEEDYHIFKVQQVVKISPTGKSSVFTKLKAPDWVGAVVEYDGKFLLVEEYRHGVDKIVYNFPCGTVEAGEKPIECCLRELKEEIGLRLEDVDKISILYTGCPNPAFMDNTMTFFYVRVKKDCKFTEQKLDENEFIEKAFLTKDQVNDIMLKEDTGIQFQNAWNKYLLDKRD